MTFDAFVGQFIFNFFMAYLLLLILPSLIDLFPHEPRGLRVDFKNND